MLCSRPVQAYAQLQYPTSDSLCARASAEVVFDEAQPASDEAEPSSDEAGEDATSPAADADAEAPEACARELADGESCAAEDSRGSSSSSRRMTSSRTSVGTWPQAQTAALVRLSKAV